MTFDLFDTLVNVVNHAEPSELSHQARATAVDQVWRHALTRSDSQSLRYWVAESTDLAGQTRAQVLATTDPDVRLHAVVNPAITDDERRRLLAGRMGVPLLRMALTSAQSPAVLACLYEDVLRRWPTWSARTQDSVAAAVLQGLHSAHWMTVAYENTPERDRLQDALSRVAELVLPYALVSRTPAHGLEVGIPYGFGVVASQVSERALRELLTETGPGEVTGLCLWGLLATRPTVSADLLEAILRRLASQDDWTPAQVTSDVFSLRIGIDAITLDEWDQHIADHAELVHAVAASVASGPQGELWRRAAEVADAVLAGDPFTAPGEALLTRFTGRTVDQDPVVIQAAALRTDMPMLVRFTAWTTWHEEDSDAAEQAALDHGRFPELVAALAELHVAELGETLAECLASEEEVRTCALEALTLLQEVLPDSNLRGPERLLLPLAGTAGLLVVSWAHVVDHMVTPGSSGDGLGALLVELLVEQLIDPGDWEVFACLSVDWSGTTGELFDAVDALRER